MPLSRHFYSLEEVYGAIIYTGSRGIPEETVFWCQEAVESGCVAEAIACLFESWLWYRGPFAMEWLVEARRRLGGAEVVKEDILEMAYRLSRCRIKDHSLWWLFLRQGEPVDRVTPRSPPLFPSEVEQETFFLRALYQRKARSAWWAGQEFGVERWWWLIKWYVENIVSEEERERVQEEIEVLREYECLLGYSSEEYDHAIRGAVLLHLCAYGVTKRGNPILSTLVTCTDTNRSRLPLPVVGVYGMGGRGRRTRKENTVGELWAVWEGMKGCPYWDEVMEEGGMTDSHFPNDLPDEWSSAEKEKSHGPGLLQDGERPTLWGYTRRYMLGTSRFVWPMGSGIGSMTSIQKRIEVMEWEEGVSPFVALVRGMVAEKPSSLSSPSLPPVHKKRVVQI
jgi:hypothetical protein